LQALALARGEAAHGGGNDRTTAQPCADRRRLFFGGSDAASFRAHQVVERHRRHDAAIGVALGVAAAAQRGRNQAGIRAVVLGGDGN
jgi:hypothetical protein